jgi:hypothetical protein
MIIRYIEDGRILSCAQEFPGTEPDPASSGTEPVLHIPEEKLPEDFLRTFAAGKYLVRKGKVVKNRAYKPPEPVNIEDLLPSIPGLRRDPGKAPDRDG